MIIIITHNINKDIMIDRDHRKANTVQVCCKKYKDYKNRLHTVNTIYIIN